jgi:hypothetical protein
MIILYILLGVLIYIWDDRRIKDKIRKSDADPNNSVKSNNWYRENGLIK